MKRLKQSDGGPKEKKFTGEDPEQLYFNIDYPNLTPAPVQADIDYQLSDAIIFKGLNYYVSVVRFSIDGTSIPIFLFKDDTYFVTIEKGGTYETEVVEYIPDEQVLNEQTVYSYQSFLNSINAAFALAAGSHGEDPPYMVFEDGKCPIYVPETYLADGIKIFMNRKLYAFFMNFHAKLYNVPPAAEADYEIIIEDLRNLTDDGFYKINQEYNSLFRWNEFTNVIFKSPTLGVVSEYFPDPNPTGSKTTYSSAGAGPSGTSAVTDFIPYIAPGDIAGIRGPLYYAASIYRKISLQKEVVDRISLQVFMRTREGREVPYYLPSGSNLSVKLAFLRKDAYN
jgi:hypothetical protein